MAKIKVTVSVEEDIVKLAKHKAIDKNMTLGELVESGLKYQLNK